MASLPWQNEENHQIRRPQPPPQRHQKQRRVQQPKDEGWRDDKKEEEAEQEALSVFVGNFANRQTFAKFMRRLGHS